MISNAYIFGPPSPAVMRRVQTQLYRGACAFAYGSRHKRGNFLSWDERFFSLLTQSVSSVISQHVTKLYTSPSP